MNLTTLLPAPGDKAINTGVLPCPTSELTRRHGMPRKILTASCWPVQSEFWRKRIVTADVGPFNATGDWQFLDLLAKLHAAIKVENPQLYGSLGTAGVLCCRHVRGVPGVLSNHGLGLAIDYKIDGVLDPRGDEKVQKGLLKLYSIAKRFKLYWGAEFRTEDAMHFEASRELVVAWGLL